MSSKLVIHIMNKNVDMHKHMKKLTDTMFGALQVKFDHEKYMIVHETVYNFIMKITRRF